MSSTAAVAPRQETAHLFELCNLSGKTKITYCPPSPIARGGSAGASLRYHGPEGHWTFDASQITHENTSLGQLISVVLKPQAAADALTFWLFLPPVVLAANDFESFTTYGVKNGSNVQRRGKGVNYEVERFFGDVKAVMLPV
jgi:hypothetical protein